MNTFPINYTLEKRERHRERLQLNFFFILTVFNESYRQDDFIHTLIKLRISSKNCFSSTSFPLVCVLYLYHHPKDRSYCTY